MQSQAGTSIILKDINGADGQRPPSLQKHEAGSLFPKQNEKVNLRLR